MTTHESTVFIVDDEATVRDALEWLITSVKLRVETFESAQAFLSAYDPERPGCLVLDVRMPGMSGLELMEQLASRNLTIPIIFLSAHADVPMAVRAMKGGALDFLQKPYNNQQLLERIQAALKNDLAARAARSQHAAARDKLALLSPREWEIVNLVVAGNTSKLIARELDISHKTVEVHRNRILRKLDCSSSTELVQMVLQNRGVSFMEI